MSNEVSLEDLSVVVAMIDACAVRGAFKGEELVTVGKVREKFSTIINKASAEKEEVAGE